MRMIEAVRAAITEEMERDERVLVMGEDVGRKGGVFGATDGLHARFGEARVLDTPLAESGIVGVAIGAALNGLLPIAEIQFADFIHPAFDQIVSEAARTRYRSNGDWSVPMVIRAPFGGGVHGGLYHSQSVEAFYAHVPGIKVVVPSTPADAHGLLKAAVRDPDPVLMLEHKKVYRLVAEEVPDGDHVLAIGPAAGGGLLVAIGAPGAAGKGTVYTGELQAGGTPTLAALAATASGANFGVSLAMAGGPLLAVGAPGDADPGGTAGPTGAVWFFTHDGAGWAAGPEPLYGQVGGSGFGSSVALAASGDDQHLVVGAPGATVAYRGSRTGTGPFSADTPLIRISPKEGDGFGKAVSASAYKDGVWCLVAAPGNPKGGVDSGGFLYADGEDRPTWIATPELTAAPPIRWGGRSSVAPRSSPA